MKLETRNIKKWFIWKYYFHIGKYITYYGI